MKKIIFLLIPLFLAGALSAQEVPLDSVQLKPVRGSLVTYYSLTAKTPHVMVCFWSVNIPATIDELNAISKQYEKWKQLGSFRLLAVCIDEGNLLGRMRPTANMNGWTFDVFGDINGDLQRILHTGTLPQSFILDKGQVVYQQSGFAAGTEDYLFSKIAALH